MISKINQLRTKVLDKLKQKSSQDWIAEKGQINKQYIQKFIPSSPVIIDAGAHKGLDSIEFSQLIPSAEIHAFEPVPFIFEDLKKATAGYEKIKCYEVALSDRTGEQEMHISSGQSDASSSLLKPKDHLKDHPDTFFEQSINVKTITLDEWAKENSIQKIDFLWLDMQGFELNVLKASRIILPTVSAIHIEVSTRQTYENVPHYREVKAWMEAKGFKVEVEEIPSGWDMGNVLFVKNS